MLLCTSVYPPSIGGPSAQSEALARGLGDRGLEVLVVTFGDPRASGEVRGVRVRYLEERTQASRIGRNLRLAVQLDRVVADFRPDVVHMQMANGNFALFAALAARRHRVPSLVKYAADLWYERVHRDGLVDTSSVASRAYWKRRVLRSLQSGLLRLYDRVWATTPMFAERASSDFHVPAERVLLLPNMIDTRRFEAVATMREADHAPGGAGSDGRPQVVLTVARLLPFKGVETCIRALAALPDGAAVLRIAGDGDPAYRARLEHVAAELGVAERVTYLGPVDPAVVHEAYGDADAFVLASAYEAFGIVLIEAMAAGVPVVATRVGGVPATVQDGINGLLVAPGDPAAVAAALERVLTVAELRRSLITAGHQRAREFGLEHGLDVLIDTYRHLVDDRATRVATGAVSRSATP